MGNGLSYLDVREAVAGAAATLFAHGVMSRTGHGDLSARAPEDHLILTIPGRLRGLTPQELAMVSLDGEVVEGELDSLKMEIAELHARLYRLRPDIGCIIHTHSAYVLAFALANRPLPCNYEAMRFGQPAEVPVIPWRRRGTPEWIDTIVAGVQEHEGTNAVILGNHGSLVFGSTPAQTVTLSTVLEEAAEGEIHADRLGGAKPLQLGEPQPAIQEKQTDYSERPGGARP
jgi:L-ribulose-5-phosphate 4-epimerase